MRNKLLSALWLVLAGAVSAVGAPLELEFANPPAAARPGVYWYFMDGNLSRAGMTRDLEAMKAAGLGHLIFLEVNVGVPRGPVDFLSEAWQDLFVHAVREAERLGIEITLGVGPGWTGSGGPWVRPEQSMQHLVGSAVEVVGPGKFDQKLPLPPPRRPFFGEVPAAMRQTRESFFADVAVLAFPAPETPATIPDSDEKALVYRAPFSSQPGVRPYFEAPAEYPETPAGSAIPPEQILDLTSRLQPDGTLDWEIPPGKWSVMRFVSRNNGASTRPAPHPGIGFECDKFDAVALDAHFENYIGKLLRKVGERKRDAGWTLLHMDSWEMGAQNWTPKLREEFRRRRGYDPLPFYPAFVGPVVGSREITERFLWDLRLTGQELVISHHAEHLKELARKFGFGLSIEPYDMNPVNDFDLGAVADVPMCEFWSVGFNSTFSCQEASSIAHILGRPVVAAEAFTGAPGEDWKLYPGALKNQGDWAFGVGINRFTYHTFAHKPDDGRPGMVMGPYGVHWDRGQTWWPMVGAYHRYIARCQHMLRQGRTVADILYLMPEGSPNVFQPPATALSGSVRLPDRRGYNFDGCSAQALMRLAEMRAGQIVFPSGASYRLLVLPNFPTMTPELLARLESLVAAGAVIVGPPPRKSPSLVNYPACDRAIERLAGSLWQTSEVPSEPRVQVHGKGRIIWGGEIYSNPKDASRRITGAKWICSPSPAPAAPPGKTILRRAFRLPADRIVKSAHLALTADNSFTASLNGALVAEGADYRELQDQEVTAALKSGENLLEVRAVNAGDAPNPAGLIGVLLLTFADDSQLLIATDDQWRTVGPDGETTEAVRVLGEAGMSPWQLLERVVRPELYPTYERTATILHQLNVAPDFESPGPVRYTHRQTTDREIYFVANCSDRLVHTSGSFRTTAGAPELWDPVTGRFRALPEFTRNEVQTMVPLTLDAYESFFVVFPRKPAAAVAATTTAKRNFASPAPVAELTGTWDVSFDPTLGAPAQVRFERLMEWNQRTEPGVRYYSGIATYRKSFDFAGLAIPESRPIYLDLGNVQVMARVRLNGRDCGVAWTAPWRVNISDAVRATGNTLEIEVANLWPNRMIGDAVSPGQGITRTTYRPYKATDRLLPSGLLGPVRLLR